MLRRSPAKQPLACTSRKPWIRSVAGPAKRCNSPKIAAVRLICTDVDGTLLNSSQRLTPNVEAAIERANAAGIPTAVATGKARGPWTSAVLPHLPRMPGVFLQGLILYDSDGTVLHEQRLDDEHVATCIRLAEEHSLTLAAYCGERILTDRCDVHTDRLNFYSEPPPEGVGPLKHNLLGQIPVNKVIFMADDERLQAVRGTLEMALAGDVSTTTALPGMLEVLPQGASKGAGVLRLLDIVGVEPSEVMALGDGENDTELLQLAGVSVAMANASQKLKSVASHVVPSNDEDGVAVAIDKVLSGNLMSISNKPS